MIQCSITRRFTVQAAHHLKRVPEGHKCRRLHGHTYQVAITLTGVTDPTAGWFCDFIEIDKAFEEHVMSVIDHQFLNHIPGLGNPTTEVLARWLHAEISTQLLADRVVLTPSGASYRLPEGLELERVRVWETSSSWAEYVSLE